MGRLLSRPSGPLAERRRISTPAEIASALRDLDEAPDRISAAEWPGNLPNLDMAGLYSWWVDADGARHLAEGLGAPISRGRIYVGEAGATKWPSGKTGRATLASRIGRNHLRGSIRGSTFRLTLASVLVDSLGLSSTGPKHLSRESEAALSAWVVDHLEVAVHPFVERDALKHLEDEVLDALDPPLNLDGRPPSPVRARLSELRKVLTVPPGPSPAAPPPPDRVATQHDESPKQHGPTARRTLHEEIADILSEHDRALSTQEIADAVNLRGRYTKTDGSEVTRFQIHGRTRKYPHLFSRDGDKVRLAD